jgi:uncharacterized lipoprotein YddW (UPF0748 family)
MARHPLHHAVAVLVAALACLVPSVDAQAPELRACWLTHYSYVGKTEPQLRAIAQNIRAGNMNMVYVGMYSGQQTMWPSKAYQTAGGTWVSNTVDWARDMCRIMREEGLLVGAWFEYGMAVGYSTHPIAVAHPDWLARDATGDAVTGENGGFVFLSPASQPAMDMLNGMVKELAENYDFDDIQVDRIRWGRKSTGREYGYEAPCVAAYQAQYGTTPPSNVNNTQWVNFREGLVNSAMQRFYNTIKAANPTIVVSSAPVGSYGITQHMQRWSSWLSGGYIDLVMPQMYMTTLSSFQTEFNTCRTQAGTNVAKLAVGYRAQEDNDWSLVRSQMNYARGQGVLHGCLWVYHQYSAQIAIQDEIANLPLAGNPWNAAAYNPFDNDRSVQRVADNSDGATIYSELGTWSSSAQSDYHRFNSRVAQGGATAIASFATTVSRSGSYDVYAWWTASSNRAAAAPYRILHDGGATVVAADQRVNGGRWNRLGRFIFREGGNAVRVELSTDGVGGAEYVSADAIKLVHTANGENECTGAVNSTGRGALAGYAGSTSIAANDLVLMASGLPPNGVGLFFYGSTASQTPFGDGFRCVGGSISRLGPPQQANSQGATMRVVNYLAPPANSGSGLIGAGSTRRFQYWYRNVGGPGGTGFNLSDALVLDFKP